MYCHFVRVFLRVMLPPCLNGDPVMTKSHTMSSTSVCLPRIFEAAIITLRSKSHTLLGVSCEQ